MSWATIILTVLKLASALFAWAQERKHIAVGEDKAIAKASLELLVITQVGKELRETVSTMDDTGAEELWRRMLESGAS